MHYHRLSVLCALAVIARPIDSVATPFPPNWNHMHTKHRWNTIPGKWESIGRPPVGSTIDLCIALKPHREHALTDTIYEVSNPKHPKHALFFIPPPTQVTLLRSRYGAYLSKDQVAKLVAPHPYTLKLIETWLRHHGVSPSNVSTSHGGNWLTVTGVPVSTANELLGASYQLYRYAETNETILRTVGYALPTALHAHVQTVAPTTYFGSPLTSQERAHGHRGRAVAALSTRDVRVTPAALRSRYNSVTYQPAATEQNRIGITGFHGQYVGDKDLKRFMRRFRSDANDPTFLVIDINNSGYDPKKPGFEANLDMQYTQGIAWPTPHVFYSIGGQAEEFIPDSFTPVNTNEPFLGWLDTMIRSEDIPQTISTSYGGNEQTFPPDYAKSVCQLFGQLGARGISVIFASGDSGVGGADCKKNDGSGVVEFQPIFPATCPWVTSVGGTTGRIEVAAPFSSGGFSNVFKRPDYQTDAVLGFFQQLGNQHSGLYNASSRGFPDVSAQATRFVVILNNKDMLIHGTSCSAPVVAGIISLLNDYQLSQNRPVLGFLNPWLYGIASQGFNDITHGSNPGCGTGGFSAVPGWDPVTGIGTPDFQRLLERLPIPIPTPIPTN
ncbi:subtilisin-like protein [Lactarius akahatsu]|uniref:tripeptidyl-peptidase II n=1 Tax=Lactarius akahatsu TaxID=416441 RepID=A0AAD4LJ60_9AGAM|nr:subtilisin-like protein [Lactarius akahatsu]